MTGVVYACLGCGAAAQEPSPHRWCLRCRATDHRVGVWWHTGRAVMVSSAPVERGPAKEG